MAPRGRAAPAAKKASGPAADELFASPSDISGGDNIRLTDYEDCLLVIQSADGSEHEYEFSTGPGKYVEARLLIVEGAAEMAGAIHEDVWVIPAVLRGKVRNAYPKAVIGWLQRAEEPLQKGQSAPWILVDPDDDDIAKAREAWLQAELPF